MCDQNGHHCDWVTLSFCSCFLVSACATNWTFSFFHWKTKRTILHVHDHWFKVCCDSSLKCLLLQFSIENTSYEKLATCVWLLVPWSLQSRQMQISFAFPNTLCSRHTCPEHDTQSIISSISRPSAANKELRNNCGFVWRLCSFFWKSWQHNEEQATNVTILSSSQQLSSKFVMKNLFQSMSTVCHSLKPLNGQARPEPQNIHMLTLAS